jgi:hypothetical protein
MKKILKIMALANITLFASDLSAACVQRDMAGTWHTYIHYVATPSTKPLNYLFRCAFTVTNTGAVTTASRCEVSDNVSMSYIPITVNGGLLSVKNTCEVSGQITLAGGTAAFWIDEAWLNKQKNTLSGEGLDSGGWLTLNAIKQ